MNVAGNDRKQSHIVTDSRQKQGDKSEGREDRSTGQRTLIGMNDVL